MEVAVYLMSSEQLLLQIRVLFKIGELVLQSSRTGQYLGLDEHVSDIVLPLEYAKIIGMRNSFLPFQTERPSRARVGSMVMRKCSRSRVRKFPARLERLCQQFYADLVNLVSYL